MQLNEKLIAIESSTKDNKDITIRLENQIKSYELEISTMKSTFNEMKTVFTIESQLFVLILFLLNLKKGTRYTSLQKQFNRIESGSA
jgi:hypothetical protein